MSFSEVFDVTFPPDTQAANQLGADIRNFKTDIAQRLSAMSNSAVATAESMGFESVFDGMLFLDTTTGKVYVVNSGGSFAEYTPLILSNISESNTVLQAQLVAALAAIPSTSPGPITLPNGTILIAPSLIDGIPSTEVPTAPTATPGTNTNQIATCAFALSGNLPTAVTNAGGYTIKFPFTYPIGGGAPTSYICIQGGQAAGPSDVHITFNPSFLSTPNFGCDNYASSGSGTSTIKSLTASNAIVAIGDGASGVYWSASGVTAS